MNALYQASMAILGTAGLISAIVLTHILLWDYRRWMNEAEYRKCLDDHRGADASPTDGFDLWDATNRTAEPLDFGPNEYLRQRAWEEIQVIDAIRKSAVDIGKAADPAKRN